MKIEKQIFAYKELRDNGQAFFIDNYEDADRIIEALEKQIPKKPLNKTSEFSGDYGNCPCCNTILCDFDNYNYCDKCGQKLDWSE